MSFKKHFLIALWERSNNVKRMFHFRTFCFNIFSPALHVRIGLYTNSLLTNTHSNSQDPLPSCSAWLHISPLRRFLNTSCTAIREKRSRRRRSSALFIPSDYQSLSLSLPRLGRKDSATRPAICQSGPGGYAWLCPGRTACRRADVDERKRYAN